ncbi:MAG TPA: helix-turn-helix transcriptional regulator [Ktedonobacteraceae bacterium]|jgi:DNA-binding Xre family transcriptional regulator|nr:helix-turn-helix transcriptional regulator [Ktedonobacteraceae bacterium]
MVRLKVREVAEAKGMSMARLARRADIDYKTVQRIYRDPLREVTTTTLDKLAKALGVDVNELIESVPDDIKDK